MATAAQIKTLLKSHIDRDDSRFYSTALQMAAKEARAGHNKLAQDIKLLVEQSQRRNELNVVPKTTQLSRVSNEKLGLLLQISHPSIRSSELVLDSGTSGQLDKIIFEQRQKDKLSHFGLKPRRKILFTGAPGTGKTMSASMLASELKLPLYTIVLENLITRYMGETAAKLRLVFDHIAQTKAVYLFDEFDAIGAQRNAANDVGEIRRVLNSFLIFVEQDESESLILAATNHPEMLDKALHRRFDDIIPFNKPDKAQIKRIILNRLSAFNMEDLDWDIIAEQAFGLSAAEVTQSSEDAAKEAVLHHETELTTEMILNAVKRRKLSSS